MSTEVYERGPVKLYRADCLEWLPTLEAGSVSAVITDPPYGIDYQSAWRIDKSEWKPKIANDEKPFVWFLPAACRATVDNGCLLCFCRWDVQEAFRLAIGWGGWDVKSQVIWDRESHGMGDLNGCPAPQHDVVWFATKGKYKFHGARQKSVVRSLRLGGDQLFHPNQKPDELIAEIVEGYAPVGGLVLDAFTGSASTAIACIRTGRRFIGCEIETKYFDIACKRIDRELDQGRLFEPVAPNETQRELL